MAKLTNKNRLSIVNPELCKEWDYEKNGDLKPEEVSHGSSKEIWWKCGKGHRWLKSINHRMKGRGCPYCAGKLASNDNNLSRLMPGLLEEWDYSKNTITPQEVVLGSNKKVWWKCKKCNHEWKTQIVFRTHGRNYCLHCNSLGRLRKDLLEEWDFSKNEKDPNITFLHSNKKVWWRCKKCNNEWKARVADRVIGEKGCFNCKCLAILSPAISREWHPSKNGSLTPYGVLFHSNKKVWWRCKKCDHEWKTQINNRANGTGCPMCCGVVLKDGCRCDSIVEAYFHLLLTKSKIIFKHNQLYGGALQKKRYDFYLSEENKYIEVTSFNKDIDNLRGKGFYYKYLRNIVVKKLYVEKTLNAQFEFIQTRLTKKQTQYVKNNLK